MARIGHRRPRIGTQALPGRSPPGQFEHPLFKDAGKRADGWTPERRLRQAEAIQKWRPWERSTGPATPQGKAKVAQNAYKGGVWREEREMMKELRQVLREHQEALSGLAPVLAAVG